MGRRTKSRKPRRSRKSRKMVQRGGFLNLETLYKAIGMKSEKDEEKAVAAINALHKLYSNFSLDGYEEENKKQMMKMKVVVAIKILPV